MKDAKVFFQDKMVRTLVVLSFTTLLVAIFSIALFYPKIPPYIPFFNSMPWGEARLIPANLILSLPILIIGVFVINVLISIPLYKGFPLIVRILQFNTLLFIFLIFLAYLQVLLLVF